MEFNKTSVYFLPIIAYNHLVIDNRNKAFYYRGLKEWPKTPGYLRDTCLLMQDDFQAALQYFGISIIS